MIDFGDYLKINVYYLFWLVGSKRRDLSYNHSFSKNKYEQKRGNIRSC